MGRDKEKAREYQARYRAAHREERAEYQRRWHAEHPTANIESSRRNAEKRRLASIAYRQTPEGKAARRRGDAIEVASGRKAAREAVRRAIRSGRLVRLPCHCGIEATEAHHHLGYERRLDVIWLCRQHHEDAHHA